jgi:hypothetical protein
MLNKFNCSLHIFNFPGAKLLPALFAISQFAMAGMA